MLQVENLHDNFHMSKSWH